MKDMASSAQCQGNILVTWWVTCVPGRHWANEVFFINSRTATKSGMVKIDLPKMFKTSSLNRTYLASHIQYYYVWLRLVLGYKAQVQWEFSRVILFLNISKGDRTFVLPVQEHPWVKCDGMSGYRIVHKGVYLYLTHFKDLNLNLFFSMKPLQDDLQKIKERKWRRPKKK